MKELNLARWMGLLAVTLLPAEVRGQATISFANYSPSTPGWVAPWYGLAEAVPSAECVLLGPNNKAFVTAGNAALAGTGFTAELWAGVDGGWEWEVQPVGRTTFRTGTSAGMLAAVNQIPVTFALPGQRIIYQLRVWENAGGTITSWNQVAGNPSMRRGSTSIYTSLPLISGANTLPIQDSFVLLPEFAAPAPALSMSRDGCTAHTGFVPGTPTPDVYAGEDVTLAVVCPNPATTVQWKLNGTNVPGGTGLTLARPRIHASQAGLYTAIVTAPIGARTATMANSIGVSVLPAPRLTQARLHPTQGFSAVVEGVTNRMIQIEYSADLHSWEPGPTQYIDFSWACVCLQSTVTIPPPLPAGGLFYRARLLP